MTPAVQCSSARSAPPSHLTPVFTSAYRTNASLSPSSATYTSHSRHLIPTPSHTLSQSAYSANQMPSSPINTAHHNLPIKVFALFGQRFRALPSFRLEHLPCAIYSAYMYIHTSIPAPPLPCPAASTQRAGRHRRRKVGKGV
ncbi:hypothetical protein BKA81DRAFT_360964 [Phyllosticta paracitricarpa]